jgi:DNA polymerase
MAETLKEELRRYAEQQQRLFGDIVLPAGSRSQPEVPVTGSVATEDISQLASGFMDVNEEWVNAVSLDSLRQMTCECRKCPLGDTRNQFVFGVGNADADVVVIGEAPGADEDARGEPFVGMAGQLLTKILAAIHFSREDVYICNILKCRPPGNRRPENSEVEQCFPYLLKQLDLIKPKLILALGLTAANTLLGQSARMKDLRGTVHQFHGIPMVVTYHPAALLRNPQWKRPTWEDVQLLRRLYDESASVSQ